MLNWISEYKIPKYSKVDIGANVDLEFGVEDSLEYILTNVVQDGRFVAINP
jgi:hypothetical protein